MRRCSIWQWIFIVLLGPGLGHGAEDNWPRFRGPNGNGVSDATSVPTQWTDKDYNWKVKLPGIGHSSPVVWDRLIFLTCGEPESGKRIVCCLDTGDGHVLWQREFPSKTYTQHRDSTYATATPAVDQDGIVVTRTTPEEVTLLALDHAGRDVWRRSLGPFIGVQGSGTSPIIFEDLVVLSNDQENPSLLPGRKKGEPVGQSSLVALERKTGKIRWQIERQTSFSSYSTPCVYQDQGSRPRLIFSSNPHGIMMVDPIAGKIEWEFGAPFMDRAIGSPVVAPGLIIAGHGAGMHGLRYVAVRPGTPGKGEPTLAYEIKKGLPLVPTPIVKNERLYLWADNGIVSCLRLDSGKILWQERVGEAYYASPVWVNHCLYNVAKNGDVFVLAAADKYELLSRIPLGEPSFATPAVAGGVMYLRTRSQLFSLGGRRK